LSRNPPGYTSGRPFLSSISSLAISRPCHVLDRLSPLSVSTVEFQVRRPVRSTSIIAWVGLIGVSLRFVKEPPGSTLRRPFLSFLSLAISRVCHVLDRLSPLSVSTVECQVRRPVRSTSILAWAGLIGDSSRFVEEPPWLYVRATVSFVVLVPCYYSIVPRFGSIVAALCFYS
jgi:hypothetical protein